MAEEASPRTYVNFRQAMLAVAGRAWKAGETERTKIGDIVEKLSAPYPLASPELLERVIPKTESGPRGSEDAGIFVQLPPVVKESWAVPVLSFDYDFRPHVMSLRLRVGLFRLLGDRVVGVGFRCEMPEGASGMHSYCHVQYVSSLGRNREGVRLPGMGWVPETQPAFPLDAGTPLGLFLALLVALYGPEDAAIGLSGDTINSMKSDLGTIRCLERWFSIADRDNV